MSVIIAYKDDKIIAMGCDSAIADEQKETVENSGDFKMIVAKFNYSPALIGYTGTNIKIINDIRINSVFNSFIGNHNAIDLPKDQAIFEIVKDIRKVCTEDIGTLLIVCKLGIFKVFLEYNWSIQPIEQKFTAIASGRNAALGAMQMGMINKMSPKNCIKEAIRATCVYVTNCIEPIHYKELSL